MGEQPNLAALDKLKTRIQALRAKTIDNGCTEDEALNSGSGRALVVLKAAIVDSEFGKLDLKLRVLRGTSRIVSTMAYGAGGAAGASLAINPGIGETPTRQTVRKGR